MQIEYLIFNLIVLSGPLFLSFDKKVRYVRYWPIVFLSIAIVFVPFLIWDILVNESHWTFNEKFTLSFRLFGLPLGEILFFITIPFACMFIWQIMVTNENLENKSNKKLPLFIIVLALILFFVSIIKGTNYTLLVSIALALAGVLDIVLNTLILSKKHTWLFLLLVSGLIFIFNGYLTARPVVLYGSHSFLNIRLWTIPIEDFGYGYALILLNVIVFEKLKRISHAKVS